MNEPPKEQLLGLKVMRLSKPSFIANEPAALFMKEISQNTIEESMVSTEVNPSQNAISGFAELDLNLTPKEMLSLPQTFGNIFLGETFTCYISLHNDSNQICRDVSIKNELHTSSQAHMLGNNQAPTTAAELPPNASIDDVINHEVKELGNHTLVCNVSYLNAANERLTFRKFFKFPVLKPLDVKTKFYNAESDEHVYLEAQLFNSTSGPIYLERVILEPTPFYTVEEFNVDPSAVRDRSLYHMNCLQPAEARQYLYRLTSKPSNNPGSMPPGAKSAAMLLQVGKLDITWRSKMGQRGRLQTSPLSRSKSCKTPVVEDLKVSIVTVPAEVLVEEPFHIGCELTNCCERNLELMLFLKNPPACGILWSDISGRQLGTLRPGEKMKVVLQLLPICPGLQTISGLCFSDALHKKSYEKNDMAQVMVMVAF